MRSKSQTLITGVYRSGSEFVTQNINCNPEISATMYKVNVMRFVYDRYNPISVPKNYAAALDDLAERLFDRYEITLDKNSLMNTFSEYSKLDYGIFYDVIMTYLYLQDGTAHWAEKNQLEWREILPFLEIMPNGKVILILRDPRSVVASFKKDTYAKPPAYLGAVFNCLDAMLHAYKFMSELSEERFMCIRYEDFARDPVKETKKIWKFLGLNTDYDMYGHQNWKDVYGRPWHANSSFHDGQDKNPFNVEAAINRWKYHANKLEIDLTEGVCGQIMEKFGYECVNNEKDWLEIIKMFAGDDKIMGYFRNWLLTGQGVQEYPTDPLKPENWTENRQPR